MKKLIVLSALAALSLAAQAITTVRTNSVRAVSYQQFTNHIAQAITTIRLTNALETVASINSRLATINAKSEHVYFDTSAIEASQLLYLVTFYIDEAANVVRVCDQVTGKLYVGTYKPTQTIGDIIANAVDSYVSIAVSAETLDGVTVTNQTISLYEGNSPTGPPRDTAAYEGASVSFTVPRGFEYYLEITDNWEGGSHFGPHVTAGAQTGVANSAAATTFTYYDPYHMDMSGVTNFAAVAQMMSTTFANNEAAARNNMVGIEIDDEWMTETGTLQNNPMICVDVGWFTNEQNEAHLGAIMMRKWATESAITFDQRNQEIATEATAQAGIYYYGYAGPPFSDSATYDVGKTVVYNGGWWRCSTKVSTAGAWTGTTNWTLQGNLKNGAIPVFDDSATYAVNDLVLYHDTAAGDTRIYKCTTAVSVAGDWMGETNWGYFAWDCLEADISKISLSYGDEIPYSSYFLVFRSSLGSPESNVKNVIRYGHNNWPASAYRCYLNSSAAKGAWWRQYHAGQIQPAEARARWGYMRGCSSNLLAHVQKVGITSYLNSSTDSSRIETTYDRFWLPSGNEIYGSANANERDAFPYVRDLCYGAMVDYGCTITNVATNADRPTVGTTGVVYYAENTGYCSAWRGDTNAYVGFANDDGSYARDYASKAILEYDAKASFPATGSASNVYFDLATKKMWRWNSTAYADISEAYYVWLATKGRINAARRRFSVANHGSAVTCRLRSANRVNSYYVCYVNSAGNLYGYNACNAYAGVPACVIW